MSTNPSPTRELWPHFAALHEGLGSAYERYAVGQLTERLVRELGVHSVAEWPANGVLGVPGLKSLPLARLGCEITLLSPSAELLDGVDSIWRAAGQALPARIVASPENEAACAPDQFDLVWSFCAFEHARDSDALARAMLRASRRHVLVFVQNAWAPGVHLHRLQHRWQRRDWDHGRVESMRAEAVARHLERAGARVLQLGGCDLPPWPDLNVKLPRVGRSAVDLRAWRRDYGPGDPVLSARAAAAVFAAAPPSAEPLRWLLHWYHTVEQRLPGPMLRHLAHHPWVLAEKAGAALPSPRERV